MALSVEAAELVEHFQWLSEERSKNVSKEKIISVGHELADTLHCLVRLADKLNVDLMSAAKNKMKLNNEKYPVEKSRGNAKKYTEFGTNRKQIAWKFSHSPTQLSTMARIKVKLRHHYHTCQLPSETS